MYLLLLLCCFLSGRNAEENVKSTTGLLNKNVKMDCNVSHWYPKETVTKVQWMDLVYNTDEDPIEIYSSENNSANEVNSLHPNANDMEVDRNYTLSISLLDMNNDPGKYFCIIHYDNNKTHNHSYYLSVAEKPFCSGKIKVWEMEKTNLTCSTSHSGKVLPTLSWYRKDDRLKSEQTISIRRVVEVLQFQASWEDDQTTFTCQMVFGDCIEECYRDLEVYYQVRNITIEPANKFHFYAREEIKCSAHGNPHPKISFGLSSVVQTNSLLKPKTISIEKDWEEKDIQLSCSATNTLRTKTKTISRNITIRVSAKPQEKIRAAVGKAFDSTSAAIIGIIAVAAVLLIIVFICVLIKRRK